MLLRRSHLDAAGPDADVQLQARGVGAVRPRPLHEAVHAERAAHRRRAERAQVLARRLALPQTDERVARELDHVAAAARHRLDHAA